MLEVLEPGHCVTGIGCWDQPLIILGGCNSPPAGLRMTADKQLGVGRRQTARNSRMIGHGLFGNL